MQALLQIALLQADECLLSSQAEEEAARKEAEEEAARKQAQEESDRKEAAELAADPVKRMRKLAYSGASPRNILAELNTIEAEGGQIGRTRILYEVSNLSV